VRRFWSSRRIGRSANFDRKLGAYRPFTLQQPDLVLQHLDLIVLAPDLLLQQLDFLLVLFLLQLHHPLQLIDFILDRSLAQSRWRG
jgi:hypothetical protein